MRLAIAFSEARSAIGNEALFRRWVASETSYEMAYVDVLLSLARHSLPAQATPRRIF